MISKGKKEAKLERAKFLTHKYGQDQVVLEQEIKELKKKSKYKVVQANNSGQQPSSAGGGGQMS